MILRAITYTPPSCFRNPFAVTSRIRFAVRPLSNSPRLKMPPKDKYSDPKLRDEVKKEIHNGDKGGAPGQWSARKVRL